MKFAMNQNQEREVPSGLASSVVVSISGFFGWLIFAINHVSFLAPSFSLFQNIGIVVVAILIGLAILGAVRASWASRSVRRGLKERPVNEFKMLIHAP